MRKLISQILIIFTRKTIPLISSILCRHKSRWHPHGIPTNNVTPKGLTRGFLKNPILVKFYSILNGVSRSLLILSLIA